MTSHKIPSFPMVLLLFLRKKQNANKLFLDIGCFVWSFTAIRQTNSTAEIASILMVFEPLLCPLYPSSRSFQLTVTQSSFPLGITVDPFPSSSLPMDVDRSKSYTQFLLFYFFFIITYQRLLDNYYLVRSPSAASFLPSFTPFSLYVYYLAQSDRQKKQVVMIYDFNDQQ